MTQNNYPDLDLGALKLEVEKKAKLLLDEVNEENLKYFAEQLKKFTEGTMEEYMNHVFDLYAEGARKISDLNLAESFTNYTTGYEAKMRAWMKENPIEIRETVVDIPQEPSMPTKRVSPPPVLVGGTVIAVGLLILSHPWVALAAELLTLILAYRQKMAQKRDNQQYVDNLTKYKIEIARKKRSLIDGVTADLIKWLELGKTQSDSILVSYNL